MQALHDLAATLGYLSLSCAFLMMCYGSVVYICDKTEQFKLARRRRMVQDEIRKQSEEIERLVSSSLLKEVQFERALDAISDSAAGRETYALFRRH